MDGWGHHAGVTGVRSAGGGRLLWILGCATVLCYAIGYPLALLARSSVGWVFVTLGGPLLVAFVVVVIRRYGR